jgi:Protein ENHANCED DISEASE RESISTANCE 2, C-terminal
MRPTAPSPRDPTIRHAGRAHIRGKIRRVWRPRYLELCDSGLVRYYELPPTADVTLPEDSDWDHVNMIPKDALVIYHARIIDVTTLRDLHVGLPKGSYGFLFRGQRQSPLELLQQGPNVEPPREYFCAVSTLEEAQTWVIVLQWAASLETHRRSSSSDNLLRLSAGGGGGGGGINFLGDSCNIPSASSFTSSRVVVGNAITAASTPNTHHHHQTSEQDTANSSSVGSIGGATTTTTESIQSPTAAVVVSKTKHRKPVGRIVVTKVEGYRLVKLPSSVPAAVLLLQWQVAYELGILMIQGTKVEERRILRTAHDLHYLLEELSREVDSKISLTLVEDWKSKLEARPLPSMNLQDYHHVQSIVPQLVASFGFVDRMLRALAMDANIVNSDALKRCFVLDTEKPRVLTVRWWKTFSPKDLETNLTYRRHVFVSEDVIDTFVKTWLSSHVAPPVDWKVHSMMWVLQRPWIVLGGTGVGLALSVPLARAYQHMMVSINIRLDVLMGSWCLAAWYGREVLAGSHKEPPKRAQQSRPRAPTHRRVVPRPPTVENALKSTVVLTSPSTESGEVILHEEVDSSSVDSKDDLDYMEHLDEDDDDASLLVSKLSSPLPEYPHNNGESCWSSPPDNCIFRVRGAKYLEDRIKIPSGPSPFTCRGVDMWLTDNPERHIARHPCVLNGRLAEEDTFLVNFLLPFGNFVSYFTVPPISQFPDKLGAVWSKFVKGDQQYRDARLKLLPVVIDGPWIVKAAVGNGTAPALLGKVIPLQYFFSEPKPQDDDSRRTGAGGGGHQKAIYEVDVIITASSIAKGILSVVKGHTKSLTIGFAFIVEAAEPDELPENVLCAFQVHQLHLEDCPHLPECNLDDVQ